MKKIDLLNKISNNELEDKTRVIFKEHNTECIYHKKEKRFEFIEKGDWNDYFYTFDLAELNDEVEIIKEKPSKIKEITIKRKIFIDKINTVEQFKILNSKLDTLFKKNNEIVKAVNYLLEKSDKSE